MRSYWFALIVPLLYVNTRAVVAQNSVEEPPPSAIHLVGHEDAALLQRVQEVIDDWDPRKLVNPYVVSTTTIDSDGKPATRKALRRPDLAEFIADVEAAEALGKAFFWEMQAGSDFRRTADGVFVGTACASCHYRFGADPRDRHTERIPYVVWDQYPLHPEHGLEFAVSQQSYDPAVSATRQSVSRSDTPLHLIVGSQGVPRLLFNGLNANQPASAGGAWNSELFEKPGENTRTNLKEEWQMFYAGHDPMNFAFRQITSRNSPTIINAGFSDRLFHDGRAESTFNGFSIFGDFEDDKVIYRRDENGNIGLVRVAIVQAALASQAVGPIVNEIEMSYEGRTFVDLARKLLPAKILAHQKVSPQDPVLNKFAQYVHDKEYAELIKRAFRREWWDSTDASGNAAQVPLILSERKDDQGSVMEANFSLYWGLSILIYESELVSNSSPFDAMMMGKPEPVEELWKKKKAELEPIYLDRVRTNHPAPSGVEAPQHKTGTAVFQHGLRVFMNRGCIECHSGPLFSEIYDRLPEVENRLPIAATLEHTLLPVTQSDSLSIAARGFRDRILRQLSLKIEALQPALKHKSLDIARKMDLLRHEGHGSRAVLSTKLYERIGSGLGFDQAACQEFADLLLRYENECVNHLGDRPFFGEDERVAAVDNLVAPVLIEQMPIPPAQLPSRPRLPIAGALAKQPYAFYDLAYYNLGVAPPRYDRGIGTATLGDSSRAKVNEAIEFARQQDPTIEAALEGQTTLEVARELQQLEPIANARLNADQKAQLLNAVQATSAVLQSIQQSASGVSGSAYRIRRSRAQGENRAALRRALAEPPAPQSTVPAAVFVDQSWDRIALKEDDGIKEHRRSEYHFFSRARALVINEEPWGMRKPFLHDNELSFWGAFRTPSLRNVDLTGPYMHNGRLMSLHDVIEFYDDGGHVPRHVDYNPDKHPEMVELKMTGDDKLALQFFLMCLTDANVRAETGLFSHPSINVVNGYKSVDPEPVEDIVQVAEGN